MLAFDQFLRDGAAVLYELGRSSSTSKKPTRRAKLAAAAIGFQFRDAARVDMLLYGDTGTAENAVQLIFSGERVRPTRRRRIRRSPPWSSVRSMVAAGLITGEVEKSLPAELKARLRIVRETE